jgi:hypothetical protein
MVIALVVFAVIVLRPVLERTGGAGVNQDVVDRVDEVKSLSDELNDAIEDSPLGEFVTKHD